VFNKKYEWIYKTIIDHVISVVGENTPTFRHVVEVLEDVAEAGNKVRIDRE
jgi:hypothetical protein